MLPVFDFKIKKKQNFNLIGKIKVQLLMVLALTTALILSVQLVFAATLATHGSKVSQIEQEIKKLEEENTSLKIQIAQQSSLAALSKRAKQLGFTESSQTTTP